MLAATLLAACGGGSEPSGAGETTAATSTEPESSGPSAGTGSGRGGVRLTEVGNFDSPLQVTQPPGETDDLCVVEQGGTIERVSPDGDTSTFLDISGEISAGGEQGRRAALSGFQPQNWERDHKLVDCHRSRGGHAGGGVRG
ncbi:MAG: hypothetical protein U0R24_05525 [Solirubrobacterales bacterium]